MIRVFTDFQAIDDEACWILQYEGTDLSDRIQELGLAKGDKIILDALENFEVIGTLAFKFVRALGREAWVAYPDWSTRVDNSA